MVFFGVVTPLLAQEEPPPKISTPEMTLSGTPEQRAACGRDVGRFCKSVKPEEGTLGYLTCLTENKEKISTVCRAVLESKQ
jgi:hypothetical protein